ncbi:hypothetical protein D3C87_189000 [compost metagenome]
MLKRLTVLAVCILSVSVVEAKDLTSRLGIGVKNSTSMDLPELAAVYYPNSDIAVTGGLGIDTKKDESKFAFSAGIRRIVFKEANMNFYMGGSLGLVNMETQGEKESGFELKALFGAEFFFTGLDSLAFTFEGGAGVVSTKDVRFRTIADSPFRAGILFYF